MSDLELVPSEDLYEELKKRSDAIFLIQLKKRADTFEEFACDWGCGQSLALGLLERARLSVLHVIRESCYPLPEDDG